MTWTAFHTRGEVLRLVIEAADAHVDGRLPTYINEVDETFRDANELLGALLLRWHTRLSGQIDHEMAAEPMDLEAAVVTAWRKTAMELPGIRAIIDRHRDAPLDYDMALMIAKAVDKEHLLLAYMAGQGANHPACLVVGARIEARAQAAYAEAKAAAHAEKRPEQHPLLRKLKAALAA
ncbi:hypothetical protein [Nocardioides sp.]|uniref:hypothetical protein n=1 Tax=Nocardioides sp. TaxID=35761 RepID=UPI00356A5968